MREDNAERSMREAFAQTGYGKDSTVNMPVLVWCRECRTRHVPGQHVEPQQLAA